MLRWCLQFVAEHWILVVALAAIIAYVFYPPRRERERQVNALAKTIGSMTTDLLQARGKSLDNRMTLFSSQKCGCYRCCRIYSPKQITKFVGQTAHCPFCNRDAVLGDASGLEISDDFLKKMNTAWFGGNVWPAPANDGRLDPD